MPDTTGLSDFLTTVSQGVSALNNIGQLITQATTNSSSLRVAISSTFFGTVTTINTSIGLTGGPITTTGTLAVSLPVLTNSLSSAVALTNTSSYFDGPRVSQGTSGIWVAMGTVTLNDPNTAVFQVKLWDGTTVMGSGETVILNTQTIGTMTLVGVITNPSSDIKISVKDVSTTGGFILALTSGNPKDSTIVAVRIG